VQRVVQSRLLKAIGGLHRGVKTPRSQDATIHGARKRLKEARALLQLLRIELGNKLCKKERNALRDIARPLSELRDATALIDALDGMGERFPDEIDKTGWPIRRALLSRRILIRRRIMKKGRVFTRASKGLRKVHARIVRWNLGRDSKEAVKAGLANTHDRARKAMKAAVRGASDENLHEWRKRTKELRYQLELLSPLWPAAMKRRARRAKKLSDVLGDDHDLAVFRDLLRAELSASIPVDVVRKIHVLIELRRKELQTLAASIGGELLAEPRGKFAAAIE
jgi:CHAD domain-containing protein